ncbi:hypothetical protein [Bartonella jaculi]|uniref:Uncharacterized protein n=1 Tax=Bartonella jaculi TaxID=686226 RepID=A0ABP9MWU0_9HYPH
MTTISGAAQKDLLLLQKSFTYNKICEYEVRRGAEYKGQAGITASGDLQKLRYDFCTE